MKNKIIYLYILISLISIIVVVNFMNNNSYSVTDEYVYGLTAPRGRILDVNGNILVSGLVEWRFDEVKENVESYGFKLISRHQTNEWITAVFN